MAYNNEKWWHDQDMLRNQGIQSQQDHFYDSTTFALMGQNMQLNISNEALQNGYRPDMLKQDFDAFMKSRPEYVHPGPTNRDLRNPAIRNAWEEFQIIHRLGRDY